MRHKDDCQAVPLIELLHNNLAEQGSFAVKKERLKQQSRLQGALAAGIGSRLAAACGRLQA